MAQIEFLEAEERMDSNYLELGLSKSGIFTPTCGRLNGRWQFIGMGAGYRGRGNKVLVASMTCFHPLAGSEVAEFKGSSDLQVTCIGMTI